MREIKFRFFDNENKRMYYSDSQNDAKDLGAKLGQSCIATFFNNFYGLDLMQYTGLKDKNGKEIYEGDIVQSNEMLFYTGQKVFCVEYNSSWAQFGITTGADWHNLSSRKTIEVIGNIYENPELLNAN